MIAKCFYALDVSETLDVVHGLKHVSCAAGDFGVWINVGVGTSLCEYMQSIAAT